MIKSLKSGFTLAEVLTTLMVIGVVAAMTIPTLLNATDDQQSKVAFKKAMSVMSQGIQLLEAKEDECYTAGGFNTNAALAACMSKVLNGNVGGTDNDEITTSDGMTFKFYVNNGVGASALTLENACGSSFTTTDNGWKGAGNCGVVVDTNGRGKGTKSFDSTMTFTGNGFNKESTAKDQLQLSISSKGVRPLYFGEGGSNKGYDYMYGRGSDNKISSPVTGTCCQICEAGVKSTITLTSGSCGSAESTPASTGYTACNDTACTAE